MRTLPPKRPKEALARARIDAGDPAPKPAPRLNIPAPPPKTPEGFQKVMPGSAQAIVKARQRDVMATIKAGDEPLRLEQSSEAQRIALRALLPESHAGVLAEVPHSGLQGNPFDLAAVARCQDPGVSAALSTYLKPHFPALSGEYKAAVLETLEAVLQKGRADELRRMHLPVAAKGARPVTLSLESEFSFARTRQLVDFYAPDPDGILDERVMTPQLLTSFEAGGFLTKRPPHWQRLSNEQRAPLVRWKDLTRDGRFAYLNTLKREVDPKVTLHRIVNQSAAPRGFLAPDTLADKVKWETSGVGVTAELTTKSYYPTRDQLCADEAFLTSIADDKRFPAAFHYHVAVPLDSAEARKEEGPKLASLAALTDLALFTGAMKNGADLLDKKHLEVFTAHGVCQAMDAFASGEIDGDKLLEHKYHLVGVRYGAELYGDKNRLGLEIRGVMRGATSGQHVVDRTLRVATSPVLREVDTDFWLGFDSGEARLPKEAYTRALAQCKDKKLAADASLSFEMVFEYAMHERRTKDHFRMSAPFWSFETLPGVTEEEKQRIRAARDVYAQRMLMTSAKLAEAIENNDQAVTYNQVFETVHREIVSFFQASGVDEIVNRYLDGLAEKTCFYGQETAALGTR
jgi:hypothetical protein